MTRLAYGIGHWDVKPFQGDQVADPGPDRGRRRHLPQRATVGLPAARGHARPAPDRPRRTTTSRTSTPIATTSPASSARSCCRGRELSLDQVPNAGSWVNQRIIYTHGIGVAMVPVNEVTNEGQPSLFIRNLPPVSIDGAPPVTQPRIYFGERATDYVVVGAKQDEFDYPTGENDDGSDGPVHALDRHDRRHPLDTTLTRLLFALRFRDLNLLISDQITGEQPAPLPPLPGRSPRADRAVPALRQGPVPRRRRRRPPGLHPGRLHDQRPLPERAGVRPEHLAELGTRAAPTSTTSATASRSRWTRTTGRCTSTSPIPTDPLDPRLRRAIFPGLFRPLSAMPADLIAAPARPRGPVQRPDADVRPVPRDRHRSSSSATTTSGPCRRGRRASRPCRPRPTTS